MSTVAQLPVGILYGVLIIAGLISVGTLGLAAFTLYRKGKIKAGPVEMDAEPEKPEAPK